MRNTLILLICCRVGFDMSALGALQPLVPNNNKGRSWDVHSLRSRLLCLDNFTAVLTKQTERRHEDPKRSGSGGVNYLSVERKLQRPPPPPKNSSPSTSK